MIARMYRDQVGAIALFARLRCHGPTRARGRCTAPKDGTQRIEPLFFDLPHSATLDPGPSSGFARRTRPRRGRPGRGTPSSRQVRPMAGDRERACRQGIPDACPRGSVRRQSAPLAGVSRGPGRLFDRQAEARITTALVLVTIVKIRDRSDARQLLRVPPVEPGPPPPAAHCRQRRRSIRQSTRRNTRSRTVDAKSESHREDRASHLLPLGARLGRRTAAGADADRHSASTRVRWPRRRTTASPSSIAKCPAGGNRRSTPKRGRPSPTRRSRFERRSPCCRRAGRRGSTTMRTRRSIRPERRPVPLAERRRR